MIVNSAVSIDAARAALKPHLRLIETRHGVERIREVRQKLKFLRQLDCALFLKQLWLCRRSRSHGHSSVSSADQASAGIAHAKAQISRIRCLRSYSTH